MTENKHENDGKIILACLMMNFVRYIIVHVGMTEDINGKLSVLLIKCRQNDKRKRIVVCFHVHVSLIVLLKSNAKNGNNGRDCYCCAVSLFRRETLAAMFIETMLYSI
ncbi:MAG: hypothetical protein LBP40_06030 [Campylobacteraceae bacterium]|jgi:hypothetical protein|nr:hypothetical protein [Campylobacteraceae bacterium]